MSLKERLSSVTKGDFNVCAYLCFIHSVVCICWSFVDDLDLVIMVLNGVGAAYCEFYAVIRTHDTPLLFDELFDKFVEYEIFLQREERQQSSFPVTANDVFCSSFSHGCYKRLMPSLSRASPAQDNPSSSHPRNFSSGSPCICQYCDHSGHTAKTCYRLHGYPSNHSRP